MKFLKKITALLLALCLGSSLCACRAGAGHIRFTASVFDCFDTVVSIVAYDGSKSSFDEHTKEVKTLMERYDRLFDIYNAYDGVTNLYTVNAHAGGDFVTVDDDTLALLRFGQEAYTLTDGAVNICAGAVLALWHNAREAAAQHPETAALPNEAALQEAAKHTDIHCLEIEGNRVRLTDQKARLDVGAVAKGFVCDRLRAYLKEKNIWESYAISLGGNVITGGAKPDAADGKWNIELENPRPVVITATPILSVTETSVVTSGDYQRYFTVGGQRYCHIIDLATNQPAARYAAVSVLCADSAMADALSTALFILPQEEGKALIAAVPQAEALWTNADGTTTSTEGFPSGK